MDDDDQPKGFELWFGKPLALLIFFIGLPWALLSLNDQGILIGSEEFTNRYGDKSIRCTYLIGVSTAQITYLTFYKASCPFIETIPE